jgi:hypothetical protein
MKKTTDSSAKFIATLLAIAFVVTLVLSFFLYSFEKNAYNAETYKTAFLDKEFYKRIPTTLGEQLVIMANSNEAGSSEDNTGTALSLFKNLTANDWEILISELLTTEDLQAMSETNIDSLFNYFNGSTSTASISFTVLKESIESERGVNAVLALLDTQPTCTLDQIMGMTSSALTGNGLLFCKPPEIALNLAKPLIQTQLIALSQGIPQEKAYLSRENPTQALVQTQGRRIIMRLSPLVPLFLLSIITVIVVRSTKSWLKWWGYPLLISGGIGLLLSFLTKPIMQALFDARILNESSGGVSVNMLELVYDLFEAITHAFTQQSALLAFYSALFGLIMLLGVFFLDRREKSGA